jgi:hypothetical protein
MSCGKQSYDRKGATSAVNSRMRGRQTQRRRRPELLRPYYCGKCNAWHITHQEKR